MRCVLLDVFCLSNGTTVILVGDDRKEMLAFPVDGVIFRDGIEVARFRAESERLVRPGLRALETRDAVKIEIGERVLYVELSS